MSKIVNKALSTEDMTILGNIETLIEQLKLPAPAEAEEPEVEMAEEEEPEVINPEEEEEEKEEDEEAEVIVKGKKVAKEADVTTPSEGSTASDDAEERIEEPQTEETQRNADEVAKQLAPLFNLLNQAINPKKVKPVNPVLKSMQDITDILHELKSNQNSNATAIKHILDAQGVTQQMNTVQKQLKEKQEKDNPQFGPTADQFKNFLNVITKAASSKDEVQSVNDTRKITPSATVHKSLGDYNFLKAAIYDSPYGRNKVDNK